MWRSPWTRWGALFGIALGGFFDGILLHQILQWHHLLSLVPGAGDLRTQILWDGWFHALMYGVAALALWGLWRVHRSGEAGSSRRLAGALAVGFGLWHVADSVLSHWLLGIHRIKLDSDNRLLWDMIWFVAFGLVPIGLGWALQRGAEPRLTPSARAILLLGAVTVGAGAWALRAPDGQGFTTVVFAPAVEPAEAMRALAAADAQLVWSDRDVAVAVARIAPERRWRLYAHGALLVSGAGLPPGCAAWSGLSQS